MFNARSCVCKPTGFDKTANERPINPGLNWFRCRLQVAASLSARTPRYTRYTLAHTRLVVYSIHSGVYRGRGNSLGILLNDLNY